MNIIVFTGAGISVESGIPTYRTDNGLWESHKIEDVCSQEGFLRNPQYVWDFYRERYENAIQAAPNVGHQALTRLQLHCKSNNIGYTCVTQNVDGLHQRSGSEDVIELHGSLHRFRCNSCRFTTDTNLWQHKTILTCPSCKAYMRPDVVWFGENLCPDLIDRAILASKQADIIMIVGTTASVYPAAHVCTYGWHENNTSVYEFNTRQYFRWMTERCAFIPGEASQTLPAFIDVLIADTNK